MVFFLLLLLERFSELGRYEIVLELVAVDTRNVLECLCGYKS